MVQQASNPFYIQQRPVDFSPLQQGLQGFMAQQQAQQEKEAKAAEIATAQAIFNRGDPQEIANYNIKNPEMSKRMLASAGIVTFLGYIGRNSLKPATFSARSAQALPLSSI